MLKGRFKSLKKEIIEILGQNKNPIELKHALNAHGWLLKLSPKADELLQIAVLSHDIDRSTPPREIKSEGEAYDDYKARHAKRSANLISEMMKKYGYDEESRLKVAKLVEKHEVGGDKLADLIRDSDSISYFDSAIDWYLENKGLEVTKKKIEWMYKRASSRAKKYIKNLDFNPQLKSVIRD